MHTRQGGWNAARLWMAASLLLALAVAACGGAGGGTGGGDAGAVTALESYLTALVEKNEDRLVSLACAEWEMDALLEYDAFQAVGTELSGLNCQQAGSEDGAALVRCQGKILATYGEEVQEFDLGGRTYRVIPAGSDWQVCGYTVQ